MEVVIKKNKYLKWCKYFSWIYSVFFLSVFSFIFAFGILTMPFKQLASLFRCLRWFKTHCKSYTFHFGVKWINQNCVCGVITAVCGSFIERLCILYIYACVRACVRVARVFRGLNILKEWDVCGCVFFHSFSVVSLTWFLFFSPVNSLSSINGQTFSQHQLNHLKTKFSVNEHTSQYTII